MLLTAVTKAKINGNYAMACWMNHEGLMEWTQKDADAAKCLTDLHYVSSKEAHNTSVPSFPTCYDYGC
jgi:hypothetical protein